MKKYRRFLLSIFGGLAMFLLLLGIGVLRFGGFGPFAAFLNGESVYISPRSLNLGSLEAGAETVAVFQMTNLTSKEISVVGERSSCNCAFSERIPIIAMPGKTTDLRINVQLPSYENFYDQTVTFMVAEPNRLAMHPVRITATIPKPLTRPAKDTDTAANP